MIFKTKLIQTVTIACILQVALPIPIPHGNAPEDQTTTSFPLKNQSRDASRAFEASQNLMTRSESNLPVSLSPVNHEDLSILETLNPRNPVGDSSQRLVTANNPPAQRIPTQQRPIGLVADRRRPKISDALEDALEKKDFSISEPLQEKWKQYLEKRKGLQPLYKKVFCAALKHAAMKRKHLMNQHPDGELTQTAEDLISDEGDSSDTLKASQEYVDLINQIPSTEALARCTDDYHALAAEEFTKVDGLLLEGWRLKKEVLSEMEQSTTFDKSKFKQILLNQLALARLYTPATDNVHTKYVSMAAGSFVRALAPMVKHCNETGNGAKRPSEASLPAENPPKRLVHKVNPTQTGK